MSAQWTDWRASLLAAWPFDEGSGHSAWDAAAGRRDEIEHAQRKGRFQPPQGPPWGKGVSGAALSFDGYSTYIRRSAAEIRQPSEGLTVSAWIAPRTYEYGMENRLAAIVSQHDREKSEGYIFGVTRHGEWSLQLGIGGEWIELHSRDPALPLQEWSYVAATFDGTAMKLYLNGELAASKSVAAGSVIAPSLEDLTVGRNNRGAVLVEPFVMNHFSGYVDELAILDRALSAEEISRYYERCLEPHGGTHPTVDPADFGISRERFASDRHRPQYHLSAPSHWMNEPHAPIYFNGLYHLFYQYNPQGPFWHYIHWGHWVSEDLVHWRDLPPALSPDAKLDPEGVWSGSACLDEKGYPALFFTAGNNAWKPNQAVGLARSTYPHDGDNDLVHWIKHPEPIVMQSADANWLPEFRDPFVWRERGEWFMLVGTGLPDKGGTAAVYHSPDMKEWSCKGCLYLSDYGEYPELGTAWELPVLLPLPRADGRASGKHVLLISPWGPGAEVEVVYWIGSWDPDRCRFVPDREEPEIIDVGDFHFTGPSGMVDPKTGRSLLFTIAQGERTPEIDYDCGWSHGAGMPVSLTLRDDGRLGIEPIGEIAGLRGRKLFEASGLGMEDINAGLSGVQGGMLEIGVSFEQADAVRYGLSLRRTPDGEEETVLYYDREAGALMVNRERTTLDPAERTRGIQGGPLVLAKGEKFRLRVFVDRSLIEGYANGVRSLTTRAYPSRSDALGLRLWADGEVREASIEVWEMMPAFETGKSGSQKK